MHKEILTGLAAKEALKRGIDKAAEAIVPTLGPVGKTAIIDRGFNQPVISDDGVTVAREIILKDKFENMGAMLIAEVAHKTNEDAGDGTTTATVLAKAMADGAFEFLKVGASQVNHLKAGMEKGVALVIDWLKENKKDISTQEEIEQVATLSSLDPEVGKLIAEAMQEVGKDGIITVEAAPTIGYSKSVAQGLQIDTGMISAYMVTDDQKAIYEEPFILVTDKKVITALSIFGLFDKIKAAGKDKLVIIADDFSPEVINFFVLNQQKGYFNTLAIKAPAFGDYRKELLMDICAVTGATYITEELGMKFEQVEVEQLGQADKVIGNRNDTTIVGGRGDKEKLALRIEGIRNELPNLQTDFEKKRFNERLAKLAGGVGVIRVGAFTETEMKAKKYKIEDALNATKAAIQEGIVLGGGTALILAQEWLLGTALAENTSPAEKEGYKVIFDALEAPLKQLCINSGNDFATIKAHILNHKGEGYDFKNNQFCGLMQIGIVDPVKVTRLALENALSIVSNLMTAETLIIDGEKQKNPEDIV